MPGNVANAAPSTVLPQTFSTAFRHTRGYGVQINEYANGESQRALQAGSSRKRWDLAKRLTAAQLVELRDFYIARKGPLEPFFF